MSKMIRFDEEALKSIAEGVGALARAVAVTLGPRGRNVIIQEGTRSLKSTKDGVTVAKNITLKDKFANMGAQMVLEAASNTASVAGDGTTTAVVLAEAMFKLGLKNVIAGANPMQVKFGMDLAAKTLAESLRAMAKKIDTSSEILQIASISANNDETIGALIMEAMQKVGKDGQITIADAKGIDTTLDIVEGSVFDKGYASPYFVTNSEKMTVELDNAYIFITDKKISSVKDVVSILEQVQNLSKPLLIIAEDIEDEALTTLVLNKVKGGKQLCAVKAPYFGDRRKIFLQDLAVLTGSQIVSEESGHTMDKLSLEMFGRAKRIKISKDDTAIIDGCGKESAIKDRIAQIRSGKDKVSTEYEKEFLETRLAKLSGGVAVINIGAATEVELSEKKDRVEDALKSTRAAILDGVVVGGGVAFIRALKALNKLKVEDKDVLIGINIVRLASLVPATQIADNCGRQGNMVAEKISCGEGSFGYNGLKDDFSDLMLDGVIDPVLVSITALTHAASVAGMLLTVSAMVTEKPKSKQKKQNIPPMDDMEM